MILRRMKPVLKWSAWGLLVLVLVAIVAWTIGNVVADARFREAITELQAAGVATSSAELKIPPLAAAENAAPFYQAAFALMAAPEDVDREAFEKADGLKGLDAERKAGLRAWLDKNAETFEMLEKARRRPRCRFERDYAQGFEMHLPELGKARDLARLLEVRAAFQMEAGDAAGARRSVEDLLALAGAFADDRILIAQLIRLVVLDFALRRIDASVTAETPEADLKAWLALVPPAASLDGILAPGLQGELAMAGDLLRGAVEKLLTMTTGERGAGASALATAGRPVFKADGARYLRLMRRLSETAARPYLDAKPELAAIAAEAGRRSVWRPIVGLLMPALESCFKRAAVVQAKAVVLRAGLEAELARKASGRYPAEAVGRDPFTGKPPTIDGGRITSAGATVQEPIQWALRAR
jgi:hypothetical protein